MSETRSCEKIQIPVQFEGVLIGYATSNSDRHLEVKFTEATDLLAAWREEIIFGMTEALNITPERIPAHPTMKESM